MGAQELLLCASGQELLLLTVVFAEICSVRCSKSGCEEENGFNIPTPFLHFFFFEAKQVYSAPALTLSPSLIKCAFCSHGECF